MMGGMFIRGADSKDHPARTAEDPIDCQLPFLGLPSRWRRLTIVYHDGSIAGLLQSSLVAVGLGLNELFKLGFLDGEDLGRRICLFVRCLGHSVVDGRGSHDYDFVGREFIARVAGRSSHKVEAGTMLGRREFDVRGRVLMDGRCWMMANWGI